MRTAFVGVAIEGNTEASRHFIANFGEFDEVVVGRGWLSSAAVTYVWRDPRGFGGIPQLILLRRNITVNDTTISVSPDSLVLRLIGERAISAWAKSGSPVDL